jgi:hypothetical protein
MNYLIDLKSYISPMYNLYTNITGNQTIYSISDCSFLKDNLNSIYMILKENTSESTLKLAAVFIIVSLANYFHSIFLLIVIFKNILPPKRYNYMRLVKNFEKKNQSKKRKVRIRFIENLIKAFIKKQQEEKEKQAIEVKKISYK